MSDCIFCKIVAGEIPSTKIREDENFLAILDIFPNTEGQTLLMPKKHFDSEIFAIDDEIYSKYMLAAKKINNILKKGLGVHRVSMVIEGMGVNHAHIKFYPLHGLEEKWQEYRAKETVYFDHYQGYISTQLGPQADAEKLKNTAEKIISNQ